jgi:DNA-directed RNA polymerase specialized sigma24 family protein
VWVRTVAANVLRRAAQRRSRFSLQELPEGLQEPADRGAAPLRRLLDGEECRRLEQAWVLFLLHYARAYGALRERDRRALELVEVRGLSYAETGARLRVGPSNMKMIMFRSRQRIVHRMRLGMGLERASRSA